jgi:hypothetical protein
MTNTWFVMIPPSYTGKSGAEKELVDFVISYPAGSQAWSDASRGQIVQGAEGNEGNPQVSEQLVRWLGPYATQAEAKAAANPQQQSANPINDAVNAAENANIPGLAQIGAFFSDLTQRNLWLRLLKVGAGFALIVIGVIHLSGHTLTGTVATAAKAAAKAGEAAAA